ncbi:unnamed protein product [Protopolystoma xenopodis]|uniref:Uncharacterized protein n=1 Tax=Protopolystoma xenopodis TaxID=117903 RepID=A0A3S4ZZ37_9PLAT|nr:unnamed protein product [Protopolystoma xenopodis]
MKACQLSDRVEELEQEVEKYRILAGIERLTKASWNDGNTLASAEHSTPSSGPSHSAAGGTSDVSEAPSQADRVATAPRLNLAVFEERRGRGRGTKSVVEVHHGVVNADGWEPGLRRSSSPAASRRFESASEPPARARLLERVGGETKKKTAPEEEPSEEAKEMQETGAGADGLVGAPGRPGCRRLAGLGSHALDAAGGLRPEAGSPTTWAAPHHFYHRGGLRDSLSAASWLTEAPGSSPAAADDDGDGDAEAELEAKEEAPAAPRRQGRTLSVDVSPGLGLPPQAVHHRQSQTGPLWPQQSQHAARGHMLSGRPRQLARQERTMLRSRAAGSEEKRQAGDSGFCSISQTSSQRSSLFGIDPALGQMMDG